MSHQEVILVNGNDEPIGVMEKMKVHEQGLLHRAFSVFIFDSNGSMLLQKRSSKKYHGGKLWTNACCSHPFPGEEVKEASERRLKEELGFYTALEKIFVFTYYAHVENGLIEHEYDHVFAGEYEGSIEPDKDEVEEYRYESLDQIRTDIIKEPELFTSWFKIAFPEIEKWHQGKYANNKEIL